MSEHLQAAVDAADTIDWKVLAAAGGTLIGSVLITIVGWLKGQKEVASKTHLKPEGEAIQLGGVTIQDNQSLRENTTSNRDLRDQLMLLIHCTERHNKTTEEMTNAIEDLLNEVKQLRKTL